VHAPAVKENAEAKRGKSPSTNSTTSCLQLVSGNWWNLIDLLRIRFGRHRAVATRAVADTATSRKETP
jgi:hypothetical protein